MALYAFNGTWNEEQTDDPNTLEDETVRNTNVVRFKNAYAGPVAYARDGVGTRLWLIGKIFGGAFGIGGQQRLLEAMKALRRRFAEGDHVIDVVGFSRGAALALAFSNRVAAHVRGPDGKPARIRFLGLFDVVGSFGFPLNIGELKFQEYNLGYDLGLPPNVDHCFHAMAIDDPRQTFRVTRVSGAYEVWFRGAHSDIGGGNGNHGLNNIAHCWMLHKARACGLPIPESDVNGALAACDASAAVRFSSFDPINSGFRPIAAADIVHHTVVIPCGNARYCDPPAACARETPEMERLAVHPGVVT
jgi:uncharacterized protein (DUF2235 family)